jgi:hypothetical protein
MSGPRSVPQPSAPQCRAYRWQYSAGEAYERIGVDCDHVFPRSRSASDSGPRVTTPTVELVGAAAAVYRHSDENGSATARRERADMNSWCSRRTCRFG